MSNALLTYILKAKFLEGYRTYIAAVGLLGLALYMLTEGNFEGATQNFFTALVALGLRDKAEVVPVVVPDVSPPPAVLPFPQGPQSGPQGVA